MKIIKADFPQDIWCPQCTARAKLDTDFLKYYQLKEIPNDKCE